MTFLASRSPPLADESLRLNLTQLVGRLFEQQGRQLHRFDVDATVFPDLGGQLLKALEGSWCERDKPPLGPMRVRRSPAAGRRPEPGLDVRQQLHRSEMTPRSVHFPFAFGAKTPGNLVHVELSFHVLLLREVVNGEVLVADNEADLSLLSLASHLPAEPPEFGEFAGVLNIERRSVAMDDDRFIANKGATSFIVAPDAFCFRVGCRATEDASGDFQSRVNPLLLVDRRLSVPLDAWDEKDHKDPLAPSTKNLLLLARWICPLLRHSTINIDRPPLRCNPLPSPT